MMCGKTKSKIHTEKIFTIDAIRVIMDPLNWYKKDYDYDVIKVLFRHKYVHVFICEYPNVYWDMKFKKSFIESIKNWLRKRAPVNVV